MYLKKYLKRHFVFFIFLSFSFCLEAGASEYSPAVQPTGWVSEKLSGELNEYLQSQYVYAKEKELIPYIYVYSDRNRHCRSIRALMKRNDMKEAFSGTHIVMLNYFDLRRLSQRKGQKNSMFMSNFTPSIARISEEGHIIGGVMNPELYLYYPLLTKERELEKYSIKNKWTGLVPYRVFAKKLKKYFETNNGV